MAPRASWKGRMRLGEIGFGVKLYTAATTSDRVALHMVNRRTGNRLKNELVDSGTGKPVEDADEVMGYDRGRTGVGQDPAHRPVSALRRHRHAVFRPAILPGPCG
jgi:non-homologous end joining protein Ku